MWYADVPALDDSTMDMMGPEEERIFFDGARCLYACTLNGVNASIVMPTEGLVHRNAMAMCRSIQVGAKAGGKGVLVRGILP